MPVAPSSPDLPPQPPRHGANAPAQIATLLFLLQKLLDYGRNAAQTLSQRATQPDFRIWAGPFGTLDVPEILARITRGLQRLAALEARLLKRAATGRDLGQAPDKRRPDDGQPPTRAPRPPRTRRPELGLFPTAEEIEADVRRRPIGAVIADICRDLGVRPADLGDAGWGELIQAIVGYGGSFVGFMKDLMASCFGDVAKRARAALAAGGGSAPLPGGGSAGLVPASVHPP